MPKALKPIPEFASEAEERAFWQENDSAEYLDWSKAEKVRLPNLKPSSTSISLRLPVSLLESIKVVANKQDVPYQSLIKVWLSERVGSETVHKSPVSRDRK
ncbi:BrnA antitoxin family protein [Pelagibacterium sp. 26DY04]|uniref:type II toxin-antitoxin system BrnA family antitoxin n=1 Tax=unclassified Pelagibacterium TaxID=2623280 RepID=UPI002814E246|nr:MULTISPECIES: BrnA antitoxin family protein [unclassified Pelagibacterium]WMT85959.1 BrnA antitoxin family protein [Pelagibacterium sp. 26DY04]WMT89757.1 BrnA antitoxin family protein [Pelagibacterium sp. H642]